MLFGLFIPMKYPGAFLFEYHEYFTPFKIPGNHPVHFDY